MSRLLATALALAPSLDLAAVWPAGALCCEVISAEEESWGSCGSSGICWERKKSCSCHRREVRWS